MKNWILRRFDHPASLLFLDETLRGSIRALGQKAQDLLALQDPGLWAAASTPTFLKNIKRGAKILQEIGDCEAAPLSDAEAHYAFMACTFLSLHVGSWSQREKAALRIILLIVSECCPVHLEPMELPPFSQLPPGLGAQSIILKHYTELSKACTHPGPGYDLTIADALRLLRTIEQNPSLDLAPLIFSLCEITEGLRVALGGHSKTS